MHSLRPECRMVMQCLSKEERLEDARDLDKLARKNLRESSKVSHYTQIRPDRKAADAAAETFVEREFERVLGLRR